MPLERFNAPFIGEWVEFASDLLCTKRLGECATHGGRVTIHAGPLGEKSAYVDTYTPSLLHAMSREEARAEVGIRTDAHLGEDLWTGYEFSWLDSQGKPQVSGIRLSVPASTPSFVESKSMKMYLLSFSQTRFDTQAEVLNTLDQDLSLAYQGLILVELLDLAHLGQVVPQMPGRCIDAADVTIGTYSRNPELLALEADGVEVQETLHSHLFRSLCPVTGQPDWASISIEYSGPAINEVALLRYLVSYRQHPAFHETTMELIFSDLLEACVPKRLSVYGRFQRRGGLDINPFRSTHAARAPVYRLARQ